MTRLCTRRNVLALGATALLGSFTGCIFSSDPDASIYSYGLQVFNASDAAHTLTVTATLDGTEVFAETFELESKDRLERSQLFDERATYEINARLVDGTEKTGSLTVGDEDNAPVTNYHVDINTDGSLSLVLPAP